MSESPNKLIRFWQELKRRKVFKVIAMYAGTAFIILEVVNNLVNPLRLPEWTPTLVIILLAIGFPFAIIFSWIFDITPQGIKKTESIEAVRKKKSQPVTVKRKLKVSDIIIACLIVIVAILAYPKIFKKDTLERLRSSGERISVAVMPFQNITNDTIWNIWQDGIQDILITSLSNSEELKVRQTESVKSLIQSRGLDSYTSITPAFASSISQKLDANVFICGNIKQAGSTLRVYAQLIDSKTEEVFKSFQIEDSAKEDNIFKVIDSLSMMVQDFLIISKLMKEENPDVKKYQFTTKYPEAFKCVIRGNYAFYSKRDYPAAINMYLQAIAIDSNYIWPAIIISDAYYNQSLYEEGKKWCQKVYEKKEQMPVYFKTYANMEYSMYYETPYESIKYLKQLLGIDDQLPEVYFTMGINYKWLQQYSKAIPVLEKSLEIYEKWGTKPLWVLSYTSLARAYHETGQYKKGKILLKKAEKDFPDETMFSTFLFYAQAVISFDLGDTIAANRYIEKYISIYEDNSWSEANIMTNVANLYNEAGIFNKAEELYRQALSLEPESPRRLNSLAYFLVDKDRNINEGLELAEKALVLSPDHYEYLHIKGWGLYKQGKNKEALDILQKSWDLRIKNAIYDHEAFLHLEAAKKAVAGQKTN